MASPDSAKWLEAMKSEMGTKALLEWGWALGPLARTCGRGSAREAFFMVRIAAILKAKAKAKAHKEEVYLKARAKAEAEAAVRRAKAEAAKEAGVVKACCCGSDDDDVPYDKLYHDSDAEEDHETIMARIVARWDIFMKEEEARFPDQKYDPNKKHQVCLPVQRTGDASASSDSDDGHEYYLRKFGMMK
ncbi:hypothetical protein TRIUR3_10360 [Triticum urartu]|uniref:Uncharacterized protein n=2 Tax=Triticum urartu TaxID=4572 RepID=M7ZHJ3_TRIUA|nr:hypothetical protein TRIUR3_10360 [Triticum urartu]